VNVKFKLTTGSDATGITWAISGDPTPGVTFSGDTLAGTFDPSVHGKKITITVTATFTGGSDTRTYSFSPGVCKGNDSIQFVTPFPNGIVNSPYGMRFHPIQKVDKLHTGVDMIHPTVKGVNHPICAAADGIVIKARNTDPRGYGNAIHIKHTNGKGEHLCTTTYNHLFKMLVSEGDKVSAGQQIALEGGAKGVPGSGGSSGLHLHFECKLPNGSFTDPVPYLKGEVQVAGNQVAAGTPAPGSVTTQAPSGAAVNSADVAAKTGCPPTDSYPVDPSKPEPAAETAPAGTTSDPFEVIWHFTLKYEVGPHWSVPAGSAPSDPEIVAGLCDTSPQKKKCGFNIDHGGETKFGIAKVGNPRTEIKTMTYAEAKDLGYSNYWKRGRVNPSAIPAYLGMFMFDTNYNHGDGNGRTIYNEAGLSSGPWPDKASQMADLEKLYQRRLQFANTLKVVEYRKGVAARVTACYEYIKAQTL
jgi:murein DD-endopeptidase MepM/ murein hydrolase activator NlpD